MIFPEFEALAPKIPGFLRQALADSALPVHLRTALEREISAVAWADQWPPDGPTREQCSREAERRSLEPHVSLATQRELEAWLASRPYAPAVYRELIGALTRRSSGSADPAG